MITTRSHSLLYSTKEALIGTVLWEIPLGTVLGNLGSYIPMISLLLTLIFSLTSDSYNNQDIIIILGYNYNLSY